MKSLLRSFILAVCVMAATQLNASISMSIFQDLPGVGIQVRPLDRETQAFGLSAEEIEQRVRDHFSVYGIPYLDDSSLHETPGSPMLRVTVNAVRHEGGSHLFTLLIELVETVEPERPTTHLVTVPASTWLRQSLGMTSNPERVLRNLSQLLRVFSREYEQEN